MSAHKERLLAAAFLLGFFLLAEIGLRTFVVTPRLIYETDRFGGLRKPDKLYIHFSEGYSRVTTNSYGLVDDEPRDSRDKFRILLLGDSFTEAHQVPHAQRFATLLEQPLDVEVINAAHSGWSWADYLLFIEDYKERFSPDYIVLAVNNGDYRTDLLGADYNRFENISGEWRVRPKAPTPESQAGWLNRTKALLGKSAVLYHTRSRLWHLAGANGNEAPKEPSASASASSLSNEKSEAMRYCFERIKEFDIPVIILYIPRLSVSESGVGLKATDIRDLYARLSTEFGFTFIDPSEAFLGDYKEHRQALRGFGNTRAFSGHLNERGHRVVADYASKHLQDLIR
jgi:hypothetical protein